MIAVDDNLKLIKIYKLLSWLLGLGGLAEEELLSSTGVGIEIVLIELKSE